MPAPTRRRLPRGSSPRMIGGPTPSPETRRLRPMATTQGPPAASLGLARQQPVSIQQQPQPITTPAMPGLDKAAQLHAQLAQQAMAMQLSQTDMIGQFQQQLAGLMTEAQKPEKEKGQKLGKIPSGPLPGLPKNAKVVGEAHLGGLTLVQHHGVTLAAPAMKSLIQAGRMLGMPIPGGGYRTFEQQAHLDATNTAPTAAAGTSLHEKGIAIDIPTGWLQANPKVIKILERLGWHRWNPSVEPWHFSYKETG